MNNDAFEALASYPIKRINMKRNIYEERYERRRQDRKRKRLQRQRRRHIRNAILSGAGALLLIFALRSTGSKASYNAGAEGLVPSNQDSQASIASIDQASQLDSSLSISYMTTTELEEAELRPRSEKKQASFYTENIDCFLQALNDAPVYERPDAQAGENAILPQGTYVETYGSKDGFTKIRSQGHEGYVRDKDLAVIADASAFKVVDGHVIVNKKYSLDSNYETSFNETAASALRVMLEAMERDGLSLEVATQYRSAADEAKEIILEGSPQNRPEPGHAVFQTGYGVSFCLPGTDPRLDNHFEKTKQFAWLQDHASEYGYILRYPEGSEEITGYRADPTIFYYVGVEDAKIIHNENLTMEKFYGLH